MSTSDGFERTSKKKISLIGELNDKDDAEEPLLPKNTPIKANKNLNKLILVTCVCSVFMIIEVIGGYMASSIA